VRSTTLCAIDIDLRHFSFLSLSLIVCYKPVRRLSDAAVSACDYDYQSTSVMTSSCMQLPPVTRWYLLLCFTMTVACYLDVRLFCLRAVACMLQLHLPKLAHLPFSLLTCNESLTNSDVLGIESTCTFRFAMHRGSLQLVSCRRRSLVFVSQYI
jgi:hypothetical protein